jgi:hypothetical protein
MLLIILRLYTNAMYLLTTISAGFHSFSADYSLIHVERDNFSALTGPPLIRCRNLPNRCISLSSRMFFLSVYINLYLCPSPIGSTSGPTCSLLLYADTRSCLRPTSFASYALKKTMNSLNLFRPVAVMSSVSNA